MTEVMFLVALALDIVYVYGFICDNVNETFDDNIGSLSVPKLRQHMACVTLCQPGTPCEGSRTWLGKVTCAGRSIGKDMHEKGMVVESCKSDSDCTLTEDTLCYKGRCQCQIGLSRDANDRCVKRCEEYGPSFTTYDHYSIREHNTRILPGRDMTSCKQACIEETEFRCLSIELLVKGFGLLEVCHLVDGSYLDFSVADRAFNDRESSNSWSTRNCLGARVP